MTIQESIKYAYEENGWTVLSVETVIDGSFNVSFLTVEGIITRNIIPLYVVRDNAITKCEHKNPIPNN